MNCVLQSYERIRNKKGSLLKCNSFMLQEDEVWKKTRLLALLFISAYPIYQCTYQGVFIQRYNITFSLQTAGLPILLKSIALVRLTPMVLRKPGYETNERDVNRKKHERSKLPVLFQRAEYLGVSWQVESRKWGLKEDGHFMIGKSP